MTNKAMIYKEEDGTKYKISFSEELQLKNLKLSKEHIRWQKRNFYAKMALIGIIFTLTLTFLFLLYRLDRIDFFTTLIYK